MPLGKRTDFGEAKYAGVEVQFAENVVEALEVRAGAQNDLDADCHPAARARYVHCRPWPDWLALMQTCMPALTQAATIGGCAMQEAIGAGFDFVITPLINPWCKREQSSVGELILPSSTKDLTLITSQWCGQVSLTLNASPGILSRHDWPVPDRGIAGRGPLSASGSTPIHQIQNSVDKAQRPCGRSSTGLLTYRFRLASTTYLCID